MHHGDLEFLQMMMMMMMMMMMTMMMIMMMMMMMMMMVVFTLPLPHMCTVMCAGCWSKRICRVLARAIVWAL